MTNIVKLVRQGLFSSPYFPPPFSVIFATVEVQRERQRDRHSIVDIERVEFGIDVEVEENFLAAFAEGLDAGDSVVFGAVDLGDLEAVLKEDVFGHIEG
jgi:hypothetical protein